MSFEWRQVGVMTEMGVLLDLGLGAGSRVPEGPSEWGWGYCS